MLCIRRMDSLSAFSWNGLMTWMNISITQQEAVKRILTDKGFQNRERYAELQQRVQSLMGKAKLFVAGGDIEIGSEDAQTRVLRGFHELISRAYPNLRMLRGITYTENDIARLLANVDCSVRWIDERPGEAEALDTAPAAIGLPTAQALAALPDHIQFLPTDAADAEVRDAPPGACHLVLTHRHDLDLRIVHAILQRGDFAFLGMIGSRTKRAKFEHRLTELGIAEAELQRLVCPIGLPGIAGKEPVVIAIAAVAQLLQLPPA